MEVVLDSSALSHLIRTPKRVGKKSGASRIETRLDSVFRAKKLRIALDYGRSVQSEWERTCGSETVKVIVTMWLELNAFRFIKSVPDLDAETKKQLRILGFKDPIDKLLIALALAAKSRLIVSEDCDFWNPKSVKSKGDSKAPVAHFCKKRHRISMWLLADLLNHFTVGA